MCASFPLLSTACDAVCAWSARLTFGVRSYFLQPTWRLWGEERGDGVIYTVYLKKVRYHRPTRSLSASVSEIGDNRLGKIISFLVLIPNLYRALKGKDIVAATVRVTTMRVLRFI